MTSESEVTETTVPAWTKEGSNATEAVLLSKTQDPEVGSEEPLAAAGDQDINSTEVPAITDGGESILEADQRSSSCHPSETSAPQP